MGVGAGLYMHDVVVKRSRSLSHLLMSSCQSRPQDDLKVGRPCPALKGPLFTYRIFYSVINDEKGQGKGRWRDLLIAVACLSFAICCRPSVCRLSVVCNARAPYTGQWCKIRGKLVLISKSLLGTRIWAFDWYQNRWPWMTLNVVVAVILRYFSEIGSIRGALRKSGWRYSQTLAPDRNVAQSL